MKLLTVFLLITLTAFSQIQTSPLDRSDLVVLKFSWLKYHDTRGLIHGVQDEEPMMNGPVSLKSAPRKDEPERIRNMREISERRGDLRAVEQDAARSAVKSSDLYIYRVRVKNTGTRLIKSFIWEYQPPRTAQDVPTRVFFCEVKAKPGEQKMLEVLSPFGPSRIVDVSEKAVDSQNKERVVIDSILYDDGAIWQRKDWDSTILSRVAGQKVRSGKCMGL